MNRAVRAQVQGVEDSARRRKACVAPTALLPAGKRRTGEADEQRETEEKGCPAKSRGGRYNTVDHRWLTSTWVVETAFKAAASGAKAPGIDGRLTAGLKSVYGNCKADTSAAEAAVIGRWLAARLKACPDETWVRTETLKTRPSTSWKEYDENPRPFEGLSVSADLKTANDKHLQTNNKGCPPENQGGRYNTIASASFSLVCLLALLACAFGLVPQALGAGAAGAGRAECREVNSKILGHAVPYCAFLPPSYDTDTTKRFPVLYFLHGLGENEQILLNSGGWEIIEQAWADKKLGEFVLVAPAADRTFYINSKDGKVRYEDFFIREFLPAIEGNYRIHAQRYARGVTGISMGGYGALRFAFEYPQLFGSVSAHSAALIEGPHNVQITPEQQAAITRFAGTAFGAPFSRAYWDRESPFTIVRRGPKPEGLKIYFDCGTEDGYGFYQGAQAFHDLLKARGIPHEFHLYPGGHSWSYFAEHFGESLEFQSKAFGLKVGRGGK